MKIRSLFAVVSLALVVTLAAGFAPPVTAQPAGQSSQSAPQFDNDLLQGMKYRLIGPFRGGRAIAVSGVPNDINTYYFGSVAGGVWKTADAGNTWDPIFDDQPIASIGAIAVAPSDPNVIYVGTGEACLRGNISHGNGVYRSTDAGKTWTHIGLDDTRHIGQVRVHPNDPDLVYVAALGHAFGPNEQRGVFRSKDGGKSWEKILYVSENAGAIDLAFVPSNPRIIFAGFWQAHRKTWTMESGGPGSGLHVSHDGGDTWEQLEGDGLPEGTWGRVGVTVSGANPDRVWALIEADKGGLFRSDDGGKKWKLINDKRQYRQRAFYYTHVIADPQDENTVYVLNTAMYRSTDGGKSFTSIRVPHGDNHGLWINPDQPEIMINANDGGANVSLNNGKSWTRQDTLPTSQFYHVTTDNQFPYNVYGAQQDNSTVRIASRGKQGAIGRTDWFSVGGCESGYIAPDPRDPNIFYAGCYLGSISRYDHSTGQRQEINAWPEYSLGAGAAALKHRWQWTAPILFDPHDPNILYHAGEVLFKTTNEGMSWEIISPDLSYNDKTKQGPSGGDITYDNTSVEYYSTIFTVAPSTHEQGVIWAGTDDGRVWITRNGGCAEASCWTEITPKTLQESSKISILELSSFDAATAYMAVDRHKVDDYFPYIYKTTNYGKSWKLLTDGSNGIPEGAFTRSVRHDPRRKGLLYVGTELGVYVSFNDGKLWQSLQLNLPVAPVHDLVVKDDDLVIGTHGRSFWILDDLTPLHQMTGKVAKADAYLFNPRPALRLRGGFGGGRSPRNAGANPPGPAVIYYNLAEAPDDDITLEIFDSEGNSVRKLTSKKPSGPPSGGFFGGGGSSRLPKEKGLNRFVWNLRYEDPARVPKAIIWGRARGATALPGQYEIKLTVGEATYSVPLEVKPDPRFTGSPDDLRRQFDLVVEINAEVDRAHRAVNAIRDARAQVAALQKRLKKSGGEENAALLDAAKALIEKLDGVEGKIHQMKAKSGQDVLNYPILLNNKLVILAGSLEGSDRPPAEQVREVFEDLKARLMVQLDAWGAIRATDLAAFNQSVSDAGVPAVSIPEESSDED